MDKGEKLRPRQVEEGIASMHFDKFFDSLSYMKEDAIWWSFNIKNFVYKKTGSCISGQKKNTLYLQIL